MVRAIHAVLLLAVVADVRSQFFDFLSAFQPVHSTTRIYDIITRRPKTQTKNTTKIPAFYLEEEEDNRKQRKLGAIVFDLYSTTKRPDRKTTRSSINNTSNSKSHNNKSHRGSNKNRTNHRDVDVTGIDLPKVRQPEKYQYENINNDRYDTGKNTIVNYETSRPSYNDHRRYYSTQVPYTSKPGVRPIVANGPPITNRPARKQTVGVSHYDDTVTPELIIGPNEDYMNSVEKMRYIEMAEKMCDKYKALDIKQIFVIPLVPSPEPVSINVSSCTPTNVPLVVGGKVVTIQEFPHMALLGWARLQSGGYSWKCGGSLISDQYVVTAAHCAYQDRDDSVIVGPPRAVQLGSSYMDDPGAIVVKVAAVVRHPKYKLPKSYYDIALVKLVTTVTFSDMIKPACLGVPPAPGNPVIATGWGRTEFGDQSEELRSVSIAVWDMDECYNVLGTSRKLPNGPSSDSQICAGEKKGGKDTCQGDSGGPAQIQDGCIWRVVAVTSLGRSCGAPHTPALYAKVQRAFISAVAFGGQGSSHNRGTQINQQNQANNYNQNTATVWNSNSNNQWNSNQQNSQNHQTTWNTQTNNREEQNKNQQRGTTQSPFGWNNQSPGYNSGRVHNQNGHNESQNNRGQYYGYTTKKPTYYNDFGESPYQADQSHHSDGRLWWT